MDLKAQILESLKSFLGDRMANRLRPEDQDMGSEKDIYPKPNTGDMEGIPSGGPKEGSPEEEKGESFSDEEQEDLKHLYE